MLHQNKSTNIMQDEFDKMDIVQNVETILN